MTDHHDKIQYNKLTDFIRRINNLNIVDEKNFDELM